MPTCKLRFLIPLCCAFIGCGGDTGSSNAVVHPSISMNSTKATVNYGESVTISWNSSNATSVSNGSFQVGSTQLSGSITDTPSRDTTYTLTANADNGETATATVSVTVTKATSKIFFVADPAAASTSSVQSFLQGLTTTPVTVSISLPATFNADVLVLSESAQISNADFGKVTSHLSGGGGVVFIGRSTSLLATGDIANDDVSAIGSILGGAQRVGGGSFTSKVVASAPSGFPLSANLFGRDTVFNGIFGTGDGANFASPVSAGAHILTVPDGGNVQAFCITTLLGGKTGFVNDAPIGSDGKSTTLRELLLAEIRWASR